jgi:sulfur carrier protein
MAGCWRRHSRRKHLPSSDFTLNQEPQPWRQGLSIAQLLVEQGHAADSIATALNGVFVPRLQREATLIRPGDELTLIQPITGG